MDIDGRKSELSPDRTNSNRARIRCKQRKHFLFERRQRE